MKKRMIALFLACAIALTACTNQNNDNRPASSSDDASSVYGTQTTQTEAAAETTSADNAESTSSLPSPNAGEESEETESVYKDDIPEFTDMSDAALLSYYEDCVYSDLIDYIDSDEYFIENVSAVYISEEYLEELQYNSQANIFFGYTLAEVDEMFQGKKYVFTLDENCETTVEEFEEYQYDDTYYKIIRNVAIGTGVILLCVTVAIATGGAAAGAEAPAISMIFAEAAKDAAIMASSSAAISGVAAGVVTGVQTQDFNEALKSAALAGSESFKWGAITGAISGGAMEAIALKGAAMNGLTMNQAALIQRESKYPLDVIKQFNSMEQYDICKNAGLTADMINGKTALIRNIDINFIDEATGLSNLERMQQGLAALDPSGKAYELHHIGQHANSTLAILTKEEHRLGDSYKIWHELVGESEIDRKAFDLIRQNFWKALANMLT